MENQNSASTNRIPCLDGIRAISIMMVLTSHLYGTKNFEVPAFLRLASLGNLGVKIFFVISGFLITTLLLAEQRKTGTISLLKFYFNRTFRIFPAFYVFIAFITIASAAGYVSLNNGDLFHAITYTTNYHPDRAWELGHIWSLAVEEQFYIIWPVIFLLFGVRGAFFVSVAYILIGPVVRVLTWHFFPSDRVGIGETFQTVADSIATGCVLAFVRSYFGSNKMFTQIQASRLTLIFLLVCISGLNYLKVYPSLMLPIGETLLNVSIALLIDWCLRNENGYFSGILNTRPLVFIGVLSYSLYLWQQPFLNRHGDSLLTTAPLNLLCVFIFATFSYFLVERPFLSLRSQIASRWFNREKSASHVKAEPAR